MEREMEEGRDGGRGEREKEREGGGREGGREGGRGKRSEEGREGGREGEREGGRVRGREGEGLERGRNGEGGKEEEREGGRNGRREGEREGLTDPAGSRSCHTGCTGRQSGAVSAGICQCNSQSPSWHSAGSSPPPQTRTGQQYAAA